MSPEVTEVKHVGGHRLELRFDDGLTTVVDLSPRIIGRGGVARPLEDVEYFKRVRFDPELHTLVWPNGYDICPDVLYSIASGIPISWQTPEPTKAAG